MVRDQKGIIMQDGHNLDDNETSHNASRRRFLQAVAAIGAVGELGASSGKASAEGSPSAEDLALTPDQAVDEVMAGNARFVARKPIAHIKDLEIIQAQAAEGQWPIVGVLGCADSRVPVEMIFDEYIGRLFVTRIAGNITTPQIIASLEYGVAVLGLKAIIVLGHSN